MDSLKLVNSRERMLIFIRIADSPDTESDKERISVFIFEIRHSGRLSDTYCIDYREEGIPLSLDQTDLFLAKIRYAVCPRVSNEGRTPPLWTSMNLWMFSIARTSA